MHLPTGSRREPHAQIAFVPWRRRQRATGLATRPIQRTSTASCERPGKQAVGAWAQRPTTRTAARRPTRGSRADAALVACRPLPATRVSRGSPRETRLARQARLSRRSVALGVIGRRDVPEIRATQGRANHEHSPPRSPKARRAKQRAESGDCLRAPRRGQRRVWRNARQLCDRGPAVLLQEYSSHRSSTTSSQGCEQQMSTLRPREARLDRGRSRYPLR
jgi:hypothetical protein